MFTPPLELCILFVTGILTRFCRATVILYVELSIFLNTFQNVMLVKPEKSVQLKFLIKCKISRISVELFRRLRRANSTFLLKTE